MHYVELNNYLQEEYYTIEQLADKANATKDRILELAELQIIPPHSFEVTQNASIYCNIKGAFNATPVTTRYYNPSIVKWIQNAETMAKEESLAEVAIQVRKKFNQEFRYAMGDVITPGCKGLDHAWRYLMNGTWGICLKEVSVASIASKELSRLKISQICKYDDPNHTLTNQEKEDLKTAINTYEKVTKQFAPHLVPTCSRTLEIEPAVKKYLNS